MGLEPTSRIPPKAELPSNKRVFVENHKDERLLIATASKAHLILGRAIQVFVKTNPFTVKLYVDDGNKQVAVNIRSLAKRYHLTKGAIRTAALEGKLEELIAKQNMSEVLNYYENLLKKQKDNLSKSPKSNLNHRVIMNVIKVAMSQESESGVATDSLNKHTFIYTKNPDHKEIIIIRSDQISDSSVLGSGTFGKVFMVSPEAEKNPMALKLAKSRVDITDHKNARKYALHEIDILKYVTDGMDAEGIMPNPKAVFNIGIKNVPGRSRDYIGYLTPVFTCEVAQLGQRIKPQTTPKENMSGFINILNGLNRLEEKGISHGDIKTENMSYDAETGVFRLIDFGSAIQYNTLTKDALQKKYNDNEHFGSHTLALCTQRNRNDVEKAAKEGNLEAYEKAMIERNRIAVGLSFLEVVLGPAIVDSYFLKNDRGYIAAGNFTKNQLVEEFQRKGYPPELAPQILLLMDMGPQGSAISTKEAIASFQTILKSMR